ncbi:MAG: hypothetical protein LKJ17_04145 [Oscillospiraceae bacterium]|jgi:anti-sigma28 factor (negative regulator of flagellin synthesis)|nr:hypothetical protein [Oscillospiraceae bacterium]
MRIKDTGFFASPYSKMRRTENAVHTEAAKNGTDTFKKDMTQAVRADRIELSSRQEEPTDQLVGSLKDSICQELGRETGAVRLQELKDAVACGNYLVDSSALAKALLFDE